MFFILPKKEELQLDLMSIDHIETNVNARIITVYFKPWEGEYFPEIESNRLIINVQISEYTGTIGELQNYKVELHFSTIQVIKLLTDSDPYFLESVTTLSIIEVNYEIMDMVGGGSGQFYTNNFEIQFTNSLLINGSIENEQLIPVESSSLFNYENNELYIKMKETAGNEFSNEHYSGIGITVTAVQGNVPID